MSHVNPPPLKMPRTFYTDPETREFFESLLTTVRLMWHTANGAGAGGVLPVGAGGTGANSAADARANLGITIGTNIQAWDSDLDTLASLGHNPNGFIMSNGASWTSITLSQFKSLANSNNTDASFVIANVTDTTKKFNVDASGITTATTRTMTIPDADGTIVLEANTATLTNKTLSLANNTFTGTKAEFDTALTDGNFAYESSVFYSPGSFTVATETFKQQVKHLKLTTTQRATIEGTGRLRVTN